jgi:NTP pyrophosphatase (non-canonical NTP hydrolase)
MRVVHTFALLAVSPAAYDEIAAKLKAADYHHSFVDDAIDMHGIGLERGPGPHVRTIAELQTEVLRWQRHNFPDQCSHEPALGVPEELGELWEAALGLISLGGLSALVGRVCHAELKLQQSIRGTREELQARLEDAIGDLVIFLVNLCNTRGLNLQRIVDRTWSEVSKRDWKRDPLKGGGRV